MMPDGWSKLIRDLEKLEQIERQISHLDAEIDRKVSELTQRRRELVEEKNNIRKIIVMRGLYDEL